MSDLSAGTRGPHVNRAPARATWEYEHRWGAMIGDSTTLRVTRTDGGSLRVVYGREEIEIRGQLVDRVAEMIAAAAAWSDTPADRAPGTAEGGGDRG